MPPQQNVWTCEPDAELHGSERAWPGQTQRLAGRSPPGCGSQKIATSCKFNPYHGYLWPSMVQVLWILNDTQSFKCEQLRLEFGSSSSMVTEVKPPKGANTNLRRTSQGHTSIASILIFDCIYEIAGKFSFNIHWHHRRCTAVSCLWDRPGRLVSIQQADFLALTACWNNDLQYQLTPKLGFTYLSPGTRGTTAPCTWESNNRTVCSNSSWISNQVLDIIVILQKYNETYIIYLNTICPPVSLA